MSVLPSPAPPPTAEEWVAPGPDTLVQALDELDRRLVIAEALARSAARWQNQRQPDDRRCDDAAAPYLAFADAWHDAAQRSRAQWDRVEWLWQAPTLATVRTDDLLSRRYALGVRTDDAGHAWMVFRSWHQRYGPRCRTVPDLASASPGEPVEELHAVWITSGVLCPAEGAWTVEVEPLDGVGVHLVEGLVCVAATVACGCAPASTRPGEVLAPEAP